MNNREILENAPEGATHVDAEGFYWLFDGVSGFVRDKVKSGMYTPSWSLLTEQFRSLSDIRRIVELEQALADAITTINQLGGEYEIPTN